MPLTNQSQKKLNQVSNKTGVILYAPQQPSAKESHKKWNKYWIKTLRFNFSFLAKFYRVNLNIKQNVQENIVHFWFYETSTKIFALLKKPSSQFCLYATKIIMLVLHIKPTL